MTSWCIVAIPDENDITWRISSEKIPHMTLLFLGEQDGDPTRMLEHIVHVANMSLTRFGLGVDRRGVLGDDEADVLFFSGHGIDRIKQFRSDLLANRDIREAYESVEQYPEWTPHLTLGYPNSPAKPDNRDYPGISWVNFTKLALWVEQDEGFEVPLKEQEELAMSQKVEDFLEHYGVPGMKWGQRKAARASARSAAGPTKYANTKTLLTGSLGSKSRFNNPAALKKRATAGKLRTAAIPP